MKPQQQYDQALAALNFIKELAEERMAPKDQAKRLGGYDLIMAYPAIDREAFLNMRAEFFLACGLLENEKAV